MVDERFGAHHARFGELAQVVREMGVEAVDGVLLDLGVSSPQLDDAERGLQLPRRRAARHAHGPDARGDGGASGSREATESQIEGGDQGLWRRTVC